MTQSPLFNKALASPSLKYHATIGTGGIGSGHFFRLEGNQTLGREESRLGHFLDRRDYCKLHIIAHYAQMLLGDSFRSFPVGMVGDDPTGQRLLEEMREAGMKLDYVQTTTSHPTLFSFCFLYPDGGGGNLTTADSASSQVTPAFVRKTESCFREYQGQGIVLAAPEVPLDARMALLELGTQYRFFRAASFNSQEMAWLREDNVWQKLDLLAINRDEAAAFLNIQTTEHSWEDLAREVVARLKSRNPGLRISITSGKLGSWFWDGKQFGQLPAYPVTTVCTAGAGDSHLGALLAGEAAGLTFWEAHVLAALTAAMSVTSPHTIHPGFNPPALLEFAGNIQASLPEAVSAFLRRRVNGTL
jgi:sugar/nucleoside kinase (ribokinase family)